MEFQEPKIEFISIDMSVVTSSTSNTCPGEEVEVGDTASCTNEAWLKNDCSNKAKMICY